MDSFAHRAFGKNRWLRFSAAVFLFFLVLVPGAFPDNEGVLLPTGKRLSPSAVCGQPTNGFPVTMAPSPDKRWLAVLNSGSGARGSGPAQSIAVLDLKTNVLVDFPEIVSPSAKNTSHPSDSSCFLGLAFSGDGRRLYASTGSLTDPLGNGIAVYSFKEGVVKPETFWPIPLQKLAAGKRCTPVREGGPHDMAIPCPAGLAVVHSKTGERLLVANNLADDALLLDTRNGKILRRFDLGEGNYVPTTYPCGVAVSKDGARAWVSLWNTSSVGEIDLAAGKVVGRGSLFETSSPTDASAHPTTLLLSDDDKRLFICFSNADSVAEIAVDSGKLIDMINVTPPSQRYGGTSPTALALSQDGTQLFVALAASNAVAVVSVDPLDIVHNKPYGFIPTEAYPTALTVRGNDLYIAAAKGRGSGPNSGTVGGDGVIAGTKRPMVSTLVHGSLAHVSIDDALNHLDENTKAVEKANLLDAPAPRIPFKGGGKPVKHVIYIIKEGRSYDEVLGDLKPGDGDPSLCLYGESVTPNEHALARQFGIIDNFYASGDAPADGHDWAVSAATSDYLERTWRIHGRNAQRTGDYESFVGDDPPLLLGIPDINEPASGYLWGNADTHNVTHRNYGEFIHTKLNPRSAIENVATKPELRGHFDPDYPGFDLAIADQVRADEFLREFRGFVATRPGEDPETMLPELVIIRLGNDRTLGAPASAAMIADNDLAFGRIVEAVSHSPYWEDTAILALETDAQAGADHIDAHRTTAFVISKYSPGTLQHPFVAHDFYTTVSMVHTIEILLGLPPMNQNDAYSPVMSPLFSGTGIQPPFTAITTNLTNGLLNKTSP